MMKDTKELVESLIGAKMKEAVVGEMVKAVERSVDENKDIQSIVDKVLEDYINSAEFKTRIKKEVIRVIDDYDWYDDVDLSPVSKAAEKYLKEKLAN